MGEAVPYGRWLERYGELVRAEVKSETPAASDGGVDFPAGASYWEEFLAEALDGLSAWEGPADGNTRIPTAVAEVAAEEESARALFRNVFGALFEEGARPYAGPVAGEWDRDALAPHFVVVVEGRTVLYEGEWRLEEMVVDGGTEDGLRRLYGRLAEAVADYEGAGVGP